MCESVLYGLIWAVASFGSAVLSGIGIGIAIDRFQIWNHQRKIKNDSITH